MAELEAVLGDRSLFPTLEARAYLAHASVSPPSLAVQRGVADCVAGYAAQGMQAAIAAAGLRARLRGQLAKLLNAHDDEIGLVQSTSAGVIAIARSLLFRRGERVLVFDGEFPANVTPWQQVARDQGLSVISVPVAAFLRSTAEGLALVERELVSGVRLVAVSAVQFQSGLHMPLGELAQLCHRHGAELFVDAIQALGAVPLDVRALDIDYLAAGAHKFMMGLEGIGVLYVKRSRLPALSMGLAGWTGHEDAFSFLMGGRDLLRYDRPIAQRTTFVEQGAVGIVSCAALSASLSLLQALGVQRVFEHVTRYLDALEPLLVDAGFVSLRCPDQARRSATLSVRVPEPHSLPELARALHALGITASTPDGLLRFAPHWPNALSEIPVVHRALLDALR